MEIKRVKEESYESISAYLNVMMSFVSRFDDLCFVDEDGKRYMVGIGDEKFVIVENNNGELNPYYLAFPDPMVEKIGTEAYTYEIVTQPDLKEITKKGTINGNCERLSYLPRVENYPRDEMEYLQFVEKLDSLMYQRFDVTSREDMNSACVFCQFHEPDVIHVDVVKKALFGYRCAKYDYCLGLHDKFYYQPLIKIRGLMFGTKREKYPAEEFLDEICARGFNRKIPDELSSLLTDTNEKHKTLKLITDNYRNYIKEQ